MITPDPRIERLYDYTKFHIGIYIVAAGAMVTIAGSTEFSDFLDGLIKHSVLLVGAIIMMGIAGAAGGVIISSSAIAATFDEIWKQPIGPWGFKVMAGRRWATVEHAAFWASLLLFTAAALIPA